MNKEFNFKSELWIPVYTGIKASSLQEFIEILETIEVDFIFYHIYINLFNYHNMPVYYPNSFSYWLFKNNYILLAEKISTIDPTEIYDLEELREIILKILKENYQITTNPKNIHPFYFVKAEREIIDCKKKAKNLEEFINGIKESSISSLFYHLITSKIKNKTTSNEYSLWLTYIGEDKKAHSIEQLDIYNFTLYEIKEKIIKILEE